MPKDTVTDAQPKPKHPKEVPSRVLISDSAGLTLFYKSWIDKVDKQGYRYKDPVAHAIRLKADILDVLPPSAGGCACEVNARMAKDFGTTLPALFEYIEGQKAYGERYAFMDDPKAKPLLDKLTIRHGQEESARLEALTETVAASGMMLR